MKTHRARCRVLSAVMAIAFAAPSARADVIAISPAAFPSGSALITFTGLPNGLEVNGLLFGGIQFSYSLGSGQVIIDGGPGNTNNITVPNVVSIVTPTGVLTLALPSPQNLFGFGFALLAGTPLANAVTVALFNGATPVGALSYNAVPDPLFAGGFAGIQSTLEFNRVQLTFNPTSAPFAVDNIRFANVTTAIPEPATLALVLTGLVGIAVFLRRRPLQSETD